MSSDETNQRCEWHRDETTPRGRSDDKRTRAAATAARDADDAAPVVDPVAESEPDPETDGTTASTAGSSVDDIVRSAGAALLRRLPSLQLPLLIVRDRYARGVVRLRTVENARRYAAPPEPYRLIDVDPAAVTGVRQFNRAKYVQAAVVEGGPWDTPQCEFTDLDVYQAYRAHFRDGVDWSDTSFYRRIVDDIEAGAVWWDCHSEAEFRLRCERIDELYERIEDDGYRTQAELIDDERDPIALGRRSRLLTERMKDEIAVHIAGDGEILFADGRNRLSILKLLDSGRVPMRVLKRHADWQRVRDAYVRGETWARAHDGHPDISYLQFDSVT
mgnify:CR=1 FL=1